MASTSTWAAAGSPARPGGSDRWASASRHCRPTPLPGQVTALPDAAAPRPARRWVKLMLLVVVLLMAAMWIYAFVFAPRGGVNPVRDKAWTDGAKAVCVATAARLEPLVFHTQVTEQNKA